MEHALSPVFRAGRVRASGWLLRAAIAALALACALAVSPALADPALPDRGYFTLNDDAAALSGKPAPKQLYTFGAPQVWAGPITWTYNDAGRAPSLTKVEVVSGLHAAAAQWMAACNVTIAQSAANPETATPAQTINGTAPSPYENVIGWGDLAVPPYGSANISGVTYSTSSGGRLIDADTTFSTRIVNSVQALRRVAVHEFGHTLGLAHSNVEGQVMSGPGGSGNPGVPDTNYDGTADLQADDVQGCICLYGPSAANAGQGYLCGLPSYRDFGSAALGGSSVTQSVTLRNAASSASLTLGAITFSTPDFRYAGGCAPGTTLAPGASCTFSAVFSPVGSAGAREGFAQIDAGGVGPYSFPVLGTATGTAPPRNYGGLWWNAPAGSESGWGINFTHQGSTIFATWYTYDVDGSPLWMVATAALAAPDSYTGTLYRGTGPAFKSIPFDPAAVVGTKVGTATFTFSDDSNGTFAYTVGGVTQTKSITREVFAAPAPTCVWGAQPDPALATNYQDLWWNAPAGSESGWGINFTHQGNTIFATWFTFGADGKPLWLAGMAAQTAPGTYAGILYTGTGPAFNSVPFDPAKVVGTPVGTFTLRFADGNNATFGYTVNDVAQTKQLTREIFGPPGTVCR